MLQKIKARLNNYSQAARLLRSFTILSCVYAKIPKLQYKCNVDFEDHTIALTLPLVGSEIQLVKYFETYSSAFQSATIIHEASHKCGTTDADIFSNAKAPRDVGYIPWDMIASTYDYWAYVGFCIPGEDCK